MEKLHARRVKAGDNSPDRLSPGRVGGAESSYRPGVGFGGGRNYGASQYDHAVSNRPTGSIFKPFVYAAAFNTSLAGTILTQPARPAGTGPTRASWLSSDPAPPDPGRQSGVFTAITMLNNDLTTFEGGYAPGNYHNDTRYTGQITARTALQWSENNATVSLAQMVGYNNVAALAGMPASSPLAERPRWLWVPMESTPIEMAGAYTTFANGGVENRSLAGSVRSARPTAMCSTTIHRTPSRSSIRASRI